MAIVIVVTNQKGGVGKTTTAIHLAHGLSLHGKRVLILDFDPQGQAAIALGLEAAPGIFNLLINGLAEVRETRRDNLHIIPGNNTTAAAQIQLNSESRPLSHIRDALKSLMRRYDYFILDTAPSAGGVQERAIFASNHVLLPTATDFLSSDGLVRGYEMIAQLREQRQWKGSLLGILPTFYDEISKESRAHLAALKKNFPKAVLPPIHHATILRECASEGVTIFEKNPKSRAGREYSKLIKVALQRA
jgi:chromosome partitioning protein